MYIYMKTFRIMFSKKLNFSDYEDYETAKKYNKRALDTSNVETQSEGESKKRKQLVPSRFLSDIEIDSEGECVPSPPKKHQFINVKHR